MRARQASKVFDEWRSEHLVKIGIDGVLQPVGDWVISQLLARPNIKRLAHAIQIYARASFEYYECSDPAGTNVAEHGCPRDRCRNGPHLDFCAAGFLRHIQQKLAAA